MVLLIHIYLHNYFFSVVRLIPMFYAYCIYAWLNFLFSWLCMDNNYIQIVVTFHIQIFDVFGDL